MGVRCLGVVCAVACMLAGVFGQKAAAQQIGASQSLMAQNTYSGGTVSSQASIMPDSANNVFSANTVSNLREEVAAAETNVNISAAFMHTQYHENFPGGNGDDENGFTQGFGVGASALLINGAIYHTDLYTALNYDFSAGNIVYGGHYIASGLPATATDRAVFNRIEARLGIGFPLAHGVELIPFLAAGYQAWNRNIDQKDTIGTDEFYHSGFIGGGIKLDVPVTPAIVVSATGEVLGLVGGGIAINNYDINQTFGPSIEERIALGLDYDVHGPFHVTGSAYLEAFNYSGSQPKIYDLGGLFYSVNEPLSITTQFGANLGFAYSF